MITNKIKPSDIKHFVQEQLGCGCPEEVFSKIHVIHNPDAFKGLPVDYLVEIGGRLLIAVSTQDWHSLNNELEHVFQTGRDYRDSHGFNRFRLVAATSDKDAPASMQTTYDSMAVKDEKTHLHVLGPESLPELRE